MEQPLAMPPTSPTREEREPQASRPYGMPLVDLRQMLEGDVPQDKIVIEIEFLLCRVYLSYHE